MSKQRPSSSTSPNRIDVQARAGTGASDDEEAAVSLQAEATINLPTERASQLNRLVSSDEAEKQPEEATVKPTIIPGSVEETSRPSTSHTQHQGRGLGAFIRSISSRGGRNTNVITPLPGNIDPSAVPGTPHFLDPHQIAEQAEQEYARAIESEQIREEDNINKPLLPRREDSQRSQQGTEPQEEQIEQEPVEKPAEAQPESSEKPRTPSAQPSRKSSSRAELPAEESAKSGEIEEEPVEAAADELSGPSEDSFFGDIYLPSTARPDEHLAQQLAEIAKMRAEIYAAGVDLEAEEKTLSGRADVLNIGQLSNEIAQQREAELELARIKAVQAEIALNRTKEETLALEEARVRRDLASLHTQMRAGLQNKERKLLQKHNLAMKEEQESFRRREDELKSALNERQGALKVELPDLKEQFAQNNSSFNHYKAVDSTNSLRDSLTRDEIDMYAAVRGRRYQVEWNLAPRVTRIKVDCVRAIKNKLPAGNYHVMITLYDRLGGQPMRWSEKKAGYTHTGCTAQPQQHGGKFYNLELSFNQRNNRVFLACPSKLLTRPSFVLIFELIQCGVSSASTSAQMRAQLNQSNALRGRSTAASSSLPPNNPKNTQNTITSEDKVVGWGAFPMSTANSNLIQGQFKLPLLRGAIDLSMDKFSAIERVLSSNLDEWLGNLYFDCKPWPRYIDNYTEYLVELKFTGEDQQLAAQEKQQLLQKAREDARRKKKIKAKQRQIADSDENFVVTKEEKGLSSEGNPGNSVQRSRKNRLSIDRTVAAIRAKESIAAKNKGNQKKISDSAETEEKEEDNVVESDEISSESDEDGYHRIDIGDNDSAEALIKHKASSSSNRLINVTVKKKTLPGLFKDIAEKGETTLDLPNIRNSKLKNEILANYKCSLSSESDSETKRMTLLGQLSHYKLRYLTSELSADLGLSNYYKAEFWLTLALIFLAIWLRIYTHYMGQYLYLHSVGIPVLKFNCFAYYCALEYPQQAQAIQTYFQVLMIFVGVATNVAIYGCLLAIVLSSKGLLHNFPYFISRLLLSFGMATFLDPVLIAVVDLGRHNWRGDVFKLYNLFNEAEGSGVIGAFITVVLYFGLMIASAILFYWYMLKIHMNGRMIDMHRRLISSEEAFDMPNDMELSVKTLRWILTKASTWTGIAGQKRKVVINEYNTINNEKIPSSSPADPQHNSFGLSELTLDKTLHLSIFTQSLAGELELHRHFLRQSSGAILEIFDAIELSGEETLRKLENKIIESYTQLPKKIHSALNTPTASTMKLARLQPTLLRQNSAGSGRAPAVAPGKLVNSAASKAIAGVIARQLIKAQQGTGVGSSGRNAGSSLGVELASLGTSKSAAPSPHLRLNNLNLMAIDETETDE
jgi:hypothetical protein